jgi:hypothetical protein
MPSSSTVARKKKRDHTPRRVSKPLRNASIVQQEEKLPASPLNRRWQGTYYMLVSFLIVLILPLIDYYNYLNVGHLMIEFNGRTSVSFVAIENHHDLRNISETICSDNKATNFNLCAYQIHVRMKDLLKTQRNDYEQTNLFVQYYLYTSVEIATRYGIFICRFNPFDDVTNGIKQFMYKYVNFFNFYKPGSKDYISTMKLVEVEVKSQMIKAAGRKLEVAFVIGHLSLVILLNFLLKYFFKKKESDMEDENHVDEDNQSDNEEAFTLHHALPKQGNIPNNLNMTKFILTLLVIYGHSFQLVANRQTALDPIFYKFIRHDIAVIACATLFFISGVLSTRSLMEHHKSMFKYLMQVYKRIIPTYLLMSLITVTCLGSWYANLPGGIMEYISHPYGKYLLYCKIYIYIQLNSYTNSIRTQTVLLTR